MWKYSHLVAVSASLAQEHCGIVGINTLLCLTFILRPVHVPEHPSISTPLDALPPLPRKPFTGPDCLFLPHIFLLPRKLPISLACVQPVWSREMDLKGQYRIMYQKRRAARKGQSVRHLKGKWSFQTPQIVKREVSGCTCEASTTLEEKRRLLRRDRGVFSTSSRLYPELCHQVSCLFVPPPPTPLSLSLSFSSSYQFVMLWWAGSQAIVAISCPVNQLSTQDQRWQEQAPGSRGGRHEEEEGSGEGGCSESWLFCARGVECQAWFLPWRGRGSRETPPAGQRFTSFLPPKEPRGRESERADREVGGFAFPSVEVDGYVHDTDLSPSSSVNMWSVEPGRTT